MAYIGNSPVQDETVTSAQIVDGAIVDADVNSSAAIAFSKMANLTASRLLVSDGSGDVSVSNVTSAEALLLDGGTSATSTTLAAADRLIVNDNGTIVQVALSDFETFVEGAIDTLSSAMTFSSTVTVGSDGSGQDVIFYSGTSGDNLTWDSSEECLTITGTDGAQALKVADGDLVVVDKIYLSDNDGGEYISGDGTNLTITSGNDIVLDAGSSGSVYASGAAGTGNTAFGDDSGIALTGNYNTLYGSRAGVSLVGGGNNVAMGRNALATHVDGSYNIAIGVGAMGDTDSGTTVDGSLGNVLIGEGAGGGAWANSAVNYTVGVGYEALNGAMTSDATGSVGVGYRAGNAITSGIGNVAIGYQALDVEDDGDNNTAVGYQALTAQTGTSGEVANTAVGYQSAVAITKGRFNTAVGSQSLKADDIGDRSTAVGYASLYSQNSDTDNETTGNTGVGFYSGLYNQTGVNNTYLGYSAGAGASGQSNSNNTAVGTNALLSITTGSGNVAVGFHAGDDIEDGLDNVSIGQSANTAVTSGNSNVAVGINSNIGVTTANSNTSIGSSSGSDTGGTGAYNTCVGQSAGYHLGGGANNLLLGYQAGSTSAPGDEIDSEDNQIVLGDDSITHAHIKVDWTVSSDVRDKADIEDFTDGLNFINQMRPVTYRWNNRSWYVKDNIDEYGVNHITKEDVMSVVSDGSKKKDKINLGFIAQEIQTLEQQIGYSKVKDDGSADRDTELIVDTSSNGSSLSLKYTGVIPILVNAVQELSQQVEDLKKKVG